MYFIFIYLHFELFELVAYLLQFKNLYFKTFNYYKTIRDWFESYVEITRQLNNTAFIIQQCYTKEKASWQVLLTLQFKDGVYVHQEIWYTQAHYFLKADDYMIKNNYKYIEKKKITNIHIRFIFLSEKWSHSDFRVGQSHVKIPYLPLKSKTILNKLLHNSALQFPYLRK